MTLSCITDKCGADFSQSAAGVGSLAGLALGGYGVFLANKIVISAGGLSFLTHTFLGARIGLLRKISDLTKVVAAANATEVHLQTTTDQTRVDLTTLLQTTEELRTKLHMTEKEKTVLLQSINTLEKQLASTGKQCEALDVQMLSLQVAEQEDSQQLIDLRKAQEEQSSSLRDTVEALKVNTSTVQAATQSFTGYVAKEAEANAVFRGLVERLHAEGSGWESVLAENVSLREALDTSTKLYNALAERLKGLKTLPPSPQHMQ